MAIQKWSDDIVVVELADDPQFNDDMTSLLEMLAEKTANVALNLAAVTHLNSSNISKLLRLRKQMLSAGRKLVLCAIGDQVQSVFHVTGLDGIFEFTDDVATALTAIQLAGETENSD